MGWMWIGWLVVIVAIGGGLGYLFAATRMKGDGSRESPEETLKRRYARGEIDESTYEHMLEEIRR